ncbi:hypothetical protein L798_02378 [Zootermopsis nevadensis]|uniref:Uncharacterized protein n=1 Tax=Zootermopsis nevadensis TaxID=136037 RepID=A0A067RET1_ZOONE|nr:hypothetical protein L798_02378 [Zootermopsis nevadensis]
MQQFNVPNLKGLEVDNFPTSSSLVPQHLWQQGNSDVKTNKGQEVSTDSNPHWVIMMYIFIVLSCISSWIFTSCWLSTSP